MDKLITACIVLYNNDREILLESINSFLNTKLNVELYLVDHSTSNELKDIIQNGKVTYIHNPSNPGFGAGHNFVINRIIDYSDYHLILNPDIYFEEGTVEKLLNFMEDSQEIGLVMPKVLYPNGNLQYLLKNNPTIWDMFIRSFLPKVLLPLFKNRIIRYEYRDKDYNSIMYDIPYLSGCFMFIRTSELKLVGGFDERYFLHMEDADLSRRFYKESKTAYYPFAVVYHHFGKLTHKQFKFKMITIKSAIKYFNKWGWL